MLESAITAEDADATNTPLLKFMISQLKLLVVAPGGRRYSTELIVLSFTWKMTSAALYRKLCDLFTLPSIRRLQQLSTGISVHANNIDLSYMKTRTESLSLMERHVNLIIDEVYTAARVEYHNGQFVGLTEDGDVAKTLCVFMVHSLSSKYKDVIQMVPVKSLTSDKLKLAFDSVMTALHSHTCLRVISVSVDNFAVNR